MTTAPTLEVIDSLEELLALEPEWRELLDDSDESEPTLTPEWMESWWQVFGGLDGRRLRAVVLRSPRDGRLIGLAPLLSRTHLHRRIIPVRRLELVGTGEPVPDEICSDYVGILLRRGFSEVAAEALARALVAGALGPWHELHLTSAAGDLSWTSHLIGALARIGIQAESAVVNHAPRVLLPRRFDDYLAELRASDRHLVRSSLRRFDAWANGEAVLHRATTPADLAHGWRLMLELHERFPILKGGSDAFASARFRRFHALLIPRLAERGKVEINWITVRGEPVVALYNFLWNRRLYFYQTARRGDLPPKIRPGVVAHAWAIERAIAEGYEVYDLLGGVSRYKTQLSTSMRPIVCVSAPRLAPSTVAVAATEALVAGLRPFRKRLSRP